MYVSNLYLFKKKFKSLKHVNCCVKKSWRKVLKTKIRIVTFILFSLEQLLAKWKEFILTIYSKLQL